LNFDESAIDGFENENPSWQKIMDALLQLFMGLRSQTFQDLAS